MMKTAAGSQNSNTTNDNNNHIERCHLRVLQSPHCALNCLQHVRSIGQGTIMCKLCTTQSAYHMQHVTCHTVQRDSSAIK